MKKLLMLGGSRYLIPVIQTAHRLGVEVITCDYLPDNAAHQYSDRYINQSIVDKEAILCTAEKLKVDGIMSFACDPGVVTAAYVAERMGLPFQGSYESTCILQDKGLFRSFLKENGFHVPTAKRYESRIEAEADRGLYKWPVIVKPVDSAGSKGVTRVDCPAELPRAIELALHYSACGAFIIEDFLFFKGCHSSADSFTVDGKIEFITYSDQMFDESAENKYTPAMIVWPSTMEKDSQECLNQETQRLMDLLKMKTGIYNIETCVDMKGIPYLMEVSPRGGGCKIAEIQQMSMGVDLIENEILKAVDMPLLPIKQHNIDGYWCELVLHTKADQAGILKEIKIDPLIKDRYVKNIDLSVRKGDKIYPFSGANMSLGDIFLKFDSREELDEVMSYSSEWIRIITY